MNGSGSAPDQQATQKSDRVSRAWAMRAAPDDAALIADEECGLFAKTDEAKAAFPGREPVF